METEEERTKFAAGFVKVPQSVLVDERLSAVDRVVYCLLLAHDHQKRGSHEHKGIVWPSLRRLAWLSGFCTKTLTESVKQLQKVGYIGKVPTARKGRFAPVNCYELKVTVAPPPKQEEPAKTSGVKARFIPTSDKPRTVHIVDPNPKRKVWA